MIEKRLLVTDRVRRPPAVGFSWVDRRFLREFASRLSGDAVLLYLFLAAVSDRQGLSFYSDATLAVRLRMREEAVVAARDDLVVHDLVAYQAPLTQVMSVAAATRGAWRLGGIAGTDAYVRRRRAVGGFQENP